MNQTAAKTNTIKELVNNRYAIMKYAKNRMRNEKIMQQINMNALEQKYQEMVTITEESTRAARTVTSNSIKNQSGEASTAGGTKDNSVVVTSTAPVTQVQSEVKLEE